MIWFITLVSLTGVIDDNEVNAGPETGKPVPSLKAVQIIGDHQDKTLDWSEESKNQPTFFVFVRSDKWDRPVARIIKDLDTAVNELRKEEPKVHICIIWISKDVEKAKEYLPRAQQSIKLQVSSWNHFIGEVYDITGWQLSGDGALNFVITKDGKTTWGKGYVNPNENIAGKVIQAFKAK